MPTGTRGGSPGRNRCTVTSQANSGALSGAPRTLASVAAVADQDLIQGHVPCWEGSSTGRSTMSATTVSESPPGVRQSSRPVGPKPFLTWMGLCLLGFPLGGYLGNIVAGP